MKNILRRWGWAILVMAVIFGFSSITSTVMPRFGQFDLSVKKGGHMIGYALLAFGFVRGQGHLTRRSLLLALLASMLYGASDELHQSFVMGRSSRILDVGIDSLGAALGLLVLTCSSRVRRWVML